MHWNASLAFKCCQIFKCEMSRTIVNFLQCLGTKGWVKDGLSALRSWPAMEVTYRSRALMRKTITSTVMMHNNEKHPMYSWLILQMSQALHGMRISFLCSAFFRLGLHLARHVLFDFICVLKHYGDHRACSSLEGVHLILPTDRMPVILTSGVCGRWAWTYRNIRESLLDQKEGPSSIASYFQWWLVKCLEEAHKYDMSPSLCLLPSSWYSVAYFLWTWSLHLGNMVNSCCYLSWIWLTPFNTVYEATQIITSFHDMCFIPMRCLAICIISSAMWCDVICVCVGECIRGVHWSLTSHS